MLILEQIKCIDKIGIIEESKFYIFKIKIYDFNFNSDKFLHIELFTKDSNHNLGITLSHRLCINWIIKKMLTKNTIINFIKNSNKSLLWSVDNIFIIPEKINFIKEFIL